MADVTVKRVEDFEAIFGGGFRRARAGLGVSSFGLAVMDLPPNFSELPRARPDPRRPGGGLHAAQRPGPDPRRRRGRGGVRARARGLGPRRGGRERARSSPATSPPGSSRSAARPGEVVRAARVHRGGRHAAADGQARAPLNGARRGLAEQVLVGRALEGAAAPGPSSSDHRCRQPRTSTAGHAGVLVAGQVGGGRRPRRRPRSPSPRAARGRARPCARASRRAAPARRSRSRPRPGRAARRGRSCRRSPPRARAPDARAISSRIRRAEASGSSGSRETRPVARQVRGVDAGVGADPAALRLGDQDAALGAHDRAALREDQLDQARVLAELGGRARAPRSPGSTSASSTHPSLGLRDDLLRDRRRRRRRPASRRGDRGGGDQLAELDRPSADLRQAARRGTDLRRRRSSGRARSRSPAAPERLAVVGARSGSRRAGGRARRGRRGCRGRAPARRSSSTAKRDARPRAARSTWRAQLPSPKAGPIASAGASSEGVGAGAVAVGDDRDVGARASGRAAASSSRGSSSGQSPGSSADALGAERRARGRSRPVAASSGRASSGSRSDLGGGERCAWRSAIRSARRSPVTTIIRSISCGRADRLEHVGEHRLRPGRARCGRSRPVEQPLLGARRSASPGGSRSRSSAPLSRASAANSSTRSASARRPPAPSISVGQHGWTRSRSGAGPGRPRRRPSPSISPS